MAHPAVLLKQLEQRARRRFGQHFLASPSVVDRIVGRAGVGPGDRVLEIGPGLGVMTERLVATGASVVAIELDRDLHAFLEEQLDGVVLHQGDATKMDLAALLPGSGWRCVANLPYNVGTRLMTTMVRMPHTFDRLVLMLQREVAERVVAPAGARNRGSLSVFCEAYATASLCFRVSPGSFHPPPKVDSAVIALDLRPEPLTGGADPQHFERVVRAAFSAPRKTVYNSLSSAFDRAEVFAALAAAEVEPRARAATLDLGALGRLARALESVP